MSWVEVDGAGWSWVEKDGAGWGWVHGLVIPIRLHNLLSMNIFFIIKYHFMVLKRISYNCKEKAENK